jgi:hypothetical protein
VLGGGVSGIGLYRNPTNKSYRLVGWSEANQELVMNCNISAEMAIAKVSEVFIQWTDGSGGAWGLNFLDGSTAAETCDCLEDAMEEVRDTQDPEGATVSIDVSPAKVDGFRKEKHESDTPAAAAVSSSSVEAEKAAMVKDPAANAQGKDTKLEDAAEQNKEGSERLQKEKEKEREREEAEKKISAQKVEQPKAVAAPEEASNEAKLQEMEKEKQKQNLPGTNSTSNANAHPNPSPVTASTSLKPTLESMKKGPNYVVPTFEIGPALEKRLAEKKVRDVRAASGGTSFPSLDLSAQLASMKEEILREMRSEMQALKRDILQQSR